MLRRRSLGLRPRLNQLNRPSPLLFTALHDPQIDNRPAAAGRRWLASASAAVSTPISSLEHDGYVYPRERPADAWPEPLDNLLDAIRRRDDTAILLRFFRWASLFTHEDRQICQEAHAELQELPSTTFSEILRFIDPVANPLQDIAYGLNLTQAQAQSTNAARFLLESHGVRKRNTQLLRAVNVVCRARLDGDRQLLPPDYHVLFRCAGAASDVCAAINAFSLMAKSGLAVKRNTSTWVEFLKARFLIDPQYYQWDRARVVAHARQLFSNKEQYMPESSWKMERIRFSRNALLLMPYGRTSDSGVDELRMRLRLKRGHGSAYDHWLRSKLYGVLLNEELLCAQMIGFARSGSLVAIKGVIFRRGFRIDFKENPDTGTVTVVGGKRFRAGNPREPTTRLLNAIVESFGCMSRITTGLKLLVHVSNVYGIPIPQETWSNLLNWAYVCASSPTRRYRNLRGLFPISNASYKHVLGIWKIMTSETYNIQPSIDDYGCYIKALIEGGDFRKAVNIIRDEVVPYYRQLEEEHFETISDDILKSRKRASTHRIQMETLKEYTWFQIASWLRKILKVASSRKTFRDGDFMQVYVPKLIDEFSDFLDPSIRYRTAQGYVQIRRPNIVKRWDWSWEMRKTLPTKAGGMIMHSLSRKGLDPSDPGLEWQQIRRMRVKHWKRKARPRVRVTGIPPEAGDVNARAWWRRLEKELRT